MSSALRKMAALIAAMVLTLSACGGSDEPAAEAPAPSTSSSSSSSPTPSDAGSVDPEPSKAPTEPSGPLSVTLDALKPLGSPPQASYRANTTFHFATGETMPLGHEYLQVVSLKEFVFGVRITNNGWVLDQINTDNAFVIKTMPIAGLFVVSDDRTVIGWVDPDGHPRAYSVEGGFSNWANDTAPGVTAAAIVGSGTCALGVLTDCTLYYSFNGEGNKSPRYITNNFITGPAVSGSAVTLFDVSNGGDMTVMRSVQDASTCNEIVNPDTGTVFAESCDLMYSTFSPSGNHVTALPSYADGLGPTQMFVVSASDGHVLAEISATNAGVLSNSRWETDTTLLVEAWDAGYWSIYRVDLTTGDVTKAVKNIAADIVDDPFTLAT